MPAHLGIDLGTSSVKCALVADDGVVIATSQAAYAIDRPHPGWAEQDPDVWWSATVQAVRAVILERPGDAPQSVGLSGQMHGVVLVDSFGEPVRHAIIWPDGRTGAEVAHWRRTLGDDFVAETCGMPIASGIAGISLAWLARHEPEALTRTTAVLQPKDYLRLRLTGQLALEATDACSSLLFSIATEQPVAEVIALAGITERQLPPLVPTLSVAGVVTTDAASATGLPAGIPVAAGGSDQAMAALALALDRPDRAAISISSGSTALVPVLPDTHDLAELSHSHHVIAGATAGSRLAMGVLLAAGLATRWLADDLLLGATSESALLEQAADILPGAAGLSANPNLGGLRTPVVDARPQGAFVGLSFEHRPPHLMRAMVDAVALSLTGSIRAIQSPAQPVREIVLSGGGSRFSVWHQAIADASELPVVLSSDLDHSSIGAALSGALAAGTPIAFNGRERVTRRVHPDPARSGAFRTARALAEERSLLPASAPLDSKVNQ